MTLACRQALIVFGLAASMPVASARAGQRVRLKATADIWVSSFRREQAHTAGRYPLLKLKSIQEMAVIRFDASAAAGREVLSARLLLHRAGKDMLRYIRVSTVNGDWTEGSNAGRLSPGDGASYDFADNATRKPWAWGPPTAVHGGRGGPWQGSQLCDVIMGSGNTLASWAERKELPDGWVAVDLPAEIVYALAVGDTDGLAVMDGGTPAFLNNFIHSVQSRWPPYIEVELGRPLEAVPAKPVVQAVPAPERAHLGSGAIRISIAPVPNVLCWRLKLDGKPVPRWRVRHPQAGKPTSFVLDELRPSAEYELEVVAVSPGGKVSAPARLSVTASPALAEPPSLGRLSPLVPRKAPAGAKARSGGRGAGKGSADFATWVCPPLVKLSPETGRVMFGDVADPANWRKTNAVWDGSTVRLFGARGEYVSYQVVVENLRAEPLTGLKVIPGDLGFGAKQVELYRCWYAQNNDKQWQPAYCVPLRAGQAVEIPDPARKLSAQKFQSFYVDIYIPKDARPGGYRGTVQVAAAGRREVIPVELEVFDFSLPDELCFWPQLNTYRLPKGDLAFFRLAHQHRCVLYYRRARPALVGEGASIKVLWDEYDRRFGPLFSGEAFKDCRRAGVPLEVISLPFYDSWPTPLTKRTYNYQGYWPVKGDGKEGIIAHYMKAPYIGKALSRQYKDAFRAVQRQFVEHFKAKGWNRTEMQCLFVGKNTHRIRYGVNMWWTTDEPYHWDDWLALRFFGRLWRSGRRAGEERQWVFRADISRPQWQDRVLDRAVDVVHFGTAASSSPAMIRRCRQLALDGPLVWRTYGSANADNTSNLGSVVWILSAYLNGSSAALPWQAMGNDRALDINDRAVGGNALLAPGERFGAAAVADMRLKAFRDAEQLCEYLDILARRRGLNREQLRAMVARAVSIRTGTRAGTSADNADALTFATLKAWQLTALRRALARLIVQKR